MTTPSPIVQYSVDGVTWQTAGTSFTSTANNAGGFIRLANTSGANFWTLTCISSDETSSVSAANASLSVNMTTKTSPVTTQALGSCLRFQSVVGIKGGPGLDANGLPNAAFTSTFQINVLTAAGNAVQAVGESGEFDPVFGYIGKTNRMARLGAGGGTTSGLNLLDVTKAPYLADTTGTVDCSAFVAQAALDVATGGYDGISFPSGIYKMSSTPVVIPKVPRFVITGVPGGTIIHTATESSVFDATTDGPANVVVVGLTVLGPDTIVLNSHAISMASIYSESLSLTDCYLSKLDSALFTEVADVYLLRVTTLGNNIGLLMNTTTTCQSGGDINECVFSDVTASIVLGTLQGG